MADTTVPLHQVILAVSLDDGRRLMRALRVGITITCVRRLTPDGQRYTLCGVFGERTVQTPGYPVLGHAIIHDLLRQLVPATFPFLP
jgi:hypothetical protein